MGSLALIIFQHASMDPRFRKNHQLHSLLKKRTYMADHELYEMMMSKQVYRAQNELRRELEKRLQTIKQDQKGKVASFMVQRATFEKMLAAREKGLSQLLNVKRELGEEPSENNGESEEDVDDFEDEHDDVYLRAQHESDLDFYVETDIRDSSNESQDRGGDSVPSANKEWMEGVTKERLENETQPKQKYETGKIHIRVSSDGRKRHGKNDDSTKRKGKNNSKETTSAGGDSKLLPKIKLPTDKHTQPRFTKSPNNHISSFEGQALLDPHNINNNKSKKSTLLAKIPEPLERERTITMLFVEESDDDSDRLSSVSLFDVEAFLKQYRQKRGHSIIVSSNVLHQSEDDEQGEVSEASGKKVKKTTNSKKRPLNWTPWGVKSVDETCPRERRKQWYQKFMTAKNARTKGHNKHTHHSDDSQDETALPLDQSPEGHRNTMDKGDLWKTPTSLDAQILADTYDLKLQRLKQHCQKLNERVALFVSS